MVVPCTEISRKNFCENHHVQNMIYTQSTYTESTIPVRTVVSMMGKVTGFTKFTKKRFSAGHNCVPGANCTSTPSASRKPAQICKPSCTASRPRVTKKSKVGCSDLLADMCRLDLDDALRLPLSICNICEEFDCGGGKIPKPQPKSCETQNTAWECYSCPPPCRRSTCRPACSSRYPPPCLPYASASCSATSICCNQPTSCPPMCCSMPPGPPCSPIEMGPACARNPCAPETVDVGSSNSYDCKMINHLPWAPLDPLPMPDPMPPCLPVAPLVSRPCYTCPENCDCGEMESDDEDNQCTSGFSPADKLAKFLSDEVQSLTAELTKSCAKDTEIDLEKCLREKYQTAALLCAETRCILSQARQVKRVECEILAIKQKVCLVDLQCHNEEDELFCPKVAVQHVSVLQSKLEKVYSGFKLKEGLIAMCKEAKNRIVARNNKLRELITKTGTLIAEIKAEIKTVEDAICMEKKCEPIGEGNEGGEGAD